MAASRKRKEEETKKRKRTERWDEERERKIFKLENSFWSESSGGGLNNCLQTPSSEWRKYTCCLMTQRSENTRERVKRVNKTTQQQQVEGNFKHFPHERSCVPSFASRQRRTFPNSWTDEWWLLLLLHQQTNGRLGEEVTHASKDK